LTSAIHVLPPVDVGKRSALMCVYTGKEVVECKVQMAVVEVAKDQVRWLRLRAGCSERGSVAGRKIWRDYSPHTTGELGLLFRPA
jgi:hypothetical protein